MVEDLHPLVEQRLRQADQRYTAGRRAMIELLVQAARPISIGDIAALDPSMARSSAYRHLVDLQQAGVVRRISASDEFARFELSEDLTEHHHHLLCVSCGRVVDVSPPPALERAVARALVDLTAREHFDAHSHRLDVFGVCRECR
ncbi:MAG: transcriptional repressor [Actinomycetota bacterium]|nr:transcriptional repressor [Actinomycetota bacterium]